MALTRRQMVQSVLVTMTTLLSVENGLVRVPLVGASDPDPLQDFCVADVQQGVIVNGFPCKSSSLVTSDDFSFDKLKNRANLTGNPFNSSATLGFVKQWPALNHMGLSIARLDIAPGGVIIPHTHNLATEILYVLEGEVYTGFVTNDNQLYAKTVRQGEAFIFPRGLVHFQFNKGIQHFASINMLNSQNPGLQLLPLALFGSNIHTDVLSKSFFLSPESVDALKDIFGQGQS